MAVCGSNRTTSTRQMIRASTSEPMAAQTVGRLTKGLPVARKSAGDLKSFRNRDRRCGRAVSVFCTSCRAIHGPVVLSSLRRAFTAGRPVACDRGAVNDRGFLLLTVVFACESLPFRGGVGLLAGCRHCRYRSCDLGRILRPHQPDLLATGAADGTASRAQGRQINGIGRCTMGANDVHGANLHNDAAEMLQADR